MFEKLETWAGYLADNTARGLLAFQGEIVADTFRVDIRTDKNSKPDYTVYYVATGVALAAFAALIVTSK